jgi:hypothetical protein
MRLCHCWRAASSNSSLLQSKRMGCIAGSDPTLGMDCSRSGTRLRNPPGCPGSRGRSRTSSVPEMMQTKNFRMNCSATGTGAIARSLAAAATGKILQRSAAKSAKSQRTTRPVASRRTR